MKKSIFFVILLLMFIGKSNAQWQLNGNALTAIPGPPYIVGGISGNYDIYFYAAGNQYMDLQYTTGNLGIGTSFSPIYKLDVFGGDINTGPLSANTAYRIGSSRVLWIGSGGSANTMVGMTAGNPGGSNNTLVGNSAGRSLQTFNTGAQNTFIGTNAGLTNTTGGGNIGVGCDALDQNSALGGNTAVGDSALYNLTTASLTTTGDVAIGNSALYTNTGAIRTTAMGEWAMRNSTAGASNTAIGYSALYNNGQAYGNTAIGNYAGAYTSTGLNTFLGDSAGWGCKGSSDTNDVFIGWQSGPASASISPNYVYIGSAYTTHISSDMAIITTWSDRRLKDDIQANVPGLAFITKLIPVTYHYDLNKAHELLGTKGSSSGKAEVEQITQSGFIAQQVDSAAQACGYDFSGVVRPKTQDGAYALGYSEFVVPLVKSVQELNTQNQTLKSTVDSLRSTIQSMQACLNQICAATGNPNVNSNPAGEQNVTLNSANSPILYQNSPNPFNTGTKINYFLPEGTMGATIVFYDTYGNQIKIIQLNQTGNGTLNITSDNLTNGIYSYSLIVNSTVVDTKKMVLQK